MLEETNKSIFLNCSVRDRVFFFLGTAINKSVSDILIEINTQIRFNSTFLQNNKRLLNFLLEDMLFIIFILFQILTNQKFEQ